MDTIKSASPLWRRSIVTRIFVVCFICIHLPLLALIASLVLVERGGDWQSLIVVLGATLAGTLMCLGILWQLIAPLRLLATEIATFRMVGQFKEERLDKRGDDEIAVVTRAVCGLVSEIEALGERNDVPVITDPLSGLMMVRTILDEGEGQFCQSSRDDQPLSVVIFDLDQFRTIREQHGRAIADKVLVAVGDVVRSLVAERYLAARMGGSIFMVLMPGASEAQVVELIAELGNRLRCLVVEPLGKGALCASFGMADRNAAMASFADLIRDADMDLFRARETGRTRRPVTA